MKMVIKIRPIGVELFHANGQTDMTGLIVTFRNFANASEMNALGGIIYSKCSIGRRIIFPYYQFKGNSE
jgi:hypothetical protein